MTGPHCGTFAASQQGSTWHERTGIPLCPNCSRSRAAYAKVYRAVSGYRVALTLGEVLRFAAAYDPSDPHGAKRALAAAITDTTREAGR